MRQEPDAVIDALAREVIGAAIEVHKVLGPGYLESVYEAALAVELTLRNIPFVRQEAIAVDYKGHAVGEGRLDLLIGGRLVVELKAVDTLAPIHSAQVISYLKSLNQPGVPMKNRTMRRSDHRVLQESLFCRKMILSFFGFPNQAKV